MPATVVILTLIFYIKVVTIKKLIIGFKSDTVFCVCMSACFSWLALLGWVRGGGACVCEGTCFQCIGQLIHGMRRAQYALSYCCVLKHTVV